MEYTKTTRLFEKVRINDKQSYGILDEEKKYKGKREELKNELDFLNPLEIILDIGAGDCEISKHIERKGAQIIALDTTTFYIRKEAMDGVCADAHYLPFKSGVFDFLLCSYVLEHLTHPSRCIKEVHRVLKVGGEALFSTPCLNIPIRKLVPIYRKLAQFEYVQSIHLHVFSAKNVISEIGKSFDIVDVKYIGFTTLFQRRFLALYPVFERLDKFFSNVSKKVKFLRLFASEVFIKGKKRVNNNHWYKPTENRQSAALV